MLHNYLVQINKENDARRATCCNCAVNILCLPVASRLFFNSRSESPQFHATAAVKCWDLRSSGLLRIVDWLVVDVSGQHIGSIF